MRLKLVLSILITCYSCNNPIKNKETPYNNDFSTRCLQNYLNSMAKVGFSGGVLVVKDTIPIIFSGYGYSDKEKSIPFTVKTPTLIASVSKPFISALFIKLENTGLIDIEDTVDKYLNDVPNDKKTIKIKHLIAHTSGLTTGITKSFNVGWSNKFLKEILSHPLLFEPGTQEYYSNDGYALLTLIAEKATGLTWENCLRKYIFNDASMTNSGTFVEDKWNTNEIAKAYNGNILQGDAKLSPWNSPSYSLQSGSIITTMSDILNFEKSLFRKEVLDEKAYKKWVYAPNQGWGNWFHNNLGAMHVVHEGYLGPFGFNSIYVRYPDYNLAIFVASNDGQYPYAERIKNDLETILFGGTVFQSPNVVNEIGQEKFIDYQFQISDSAKFLIDKKANKLTISLKNQDEVNSFMSLNQSLIKKLNKTNAQSFQLLEWFKSRNTITSNLPIESNSRKQFEKTMLKLETEFGKIKSFQIVYSYPDIDSSDEFPMYHSYCHIDTEKQSYIIKLTWGNEQFMGGTDSNAFSTLGKTLPLPFDDIPVQHMIGNRYFVYLPFYYKIVYGSVS